MCSYVTGRAWSLLLVVALACGCTSPGSRYWEGGVQASLYASSHEPVVGQPYEILIKVTNSTEYTKWVEQIRFMQPALLDDLPFTVVKTEPDAGEPDWEDVDVEDAYGYRTWLTYWVWTYMAYLPAGQTKEFKFSVIPKLAGEFDVLVDIRFEDSNLPYDHPKYRASATTALPLSIRQTADTRPQTQSNAPPARPGPTGVPLAH